MIKPIETIYNGYRFRSRLEARWAVFFDTLGVKWEYEKEGYDLKGVLIFPSRQGDLEEKVPYQGGWYLPDFWLPELDFWIEIKGQEPTDDENDRMSALAALTGKNGCILWGNIPETTEEVYQNYNWIEYRGGGYYDSNRGWTACLHCDCVGLVYSSYGKYLSCGCMDSKGSDTDRIDAAYTAARQARFEHGEGNRHKNKDELFITSSTYVGYGLCAVPRDPSSFQYRSILVATNWKKCGNCHHVIPPGTFHLIAWPPQGKGQKAHCLACCIFESIDIYDNAYKNVDLTHLKYKKMGANDFWGRIEAERPAWNEIFPKDYEDIPEPYEDDISDFEHGEEPK